MSSSGTQYFVVVDGTEVDTKSKRDRAVEVADGLRAEHPTADILVRTAAGNVVHTVKVKGVHTKPWNRVEEWDGMEIEVPAGYTVAYTRKRVGAVVARAEDKSGWLVLTEDGKRFEAKNTVEARDITNRLGDDHKSAREAAKLADAEKRAAAKVERDEARAKARAEKDAEKARKAQERADAKAAKEAEKAAKEEAPASA